MGTTDVRVTVVTMRSTNVHRLRFTTSVTPRKTPYGSARFNVKHFVEEVSAPYALLVSPVIVSRIIYTQRVMSFSSTVDAAGTVICYGTAGTPLPHCVS